MTALLATRAARRAAEAATDAAALIDEGKADAASATLAEARRHLDQAAGILRPTADQQRAECAAERRRLFARMAERFAKNEPDAAEADEFRGRIDRWLAHLLPDLTVEERNARWEEYTEALNVRDGVAAGVIHWSEVEPKLVGPGRSEDAHQIVCRRVDDALAALIGGAR